MVNYEKIFEPYYEGGWEAYPLETTLVTAGALNAYDAAIMHIEDYLDTQVDPNDNLAETYSDEETYEAGDYRIYNGVLYKCLEDIDEAEDFDPTKWESCLITDEMGSGGGGGTTVIANPVGEPTDDLETIQIGNVIYDIPGGGGNANIWTGTQAEYEAQASQIPDDTVVLITDDEDVIAVDGGEIYSEDEQVIGTWTDGSTLYRKTFMMTGSDVPVNNTPKGIDVGTVNIKSIDGYLSLGDEIMPMNFYYDSSLNVNARYVKSEHTVWIVPRIPNRTCSEASLTVTYTKSSS